MLRPIVRQYKQLRKDGFTIVELLVVIVVIAILAAITIVSYNGIQSRAQTSVTVNGLRQAVQVLESYRIANGAYPLVSADANDTSDTMACLGQGYPDGMCSEVRSCPGYDVSLSLTSESTYLNSQLQEFLQSPLPAMKQAPMPTILAPGCAITQTGAIYSVGCERTKVTLFAGFDPTPALWSGLDCMGGAYMITYAVQGGEGACALSEAIDLTDVYRSVAGEEYMPNGWRSCMIVNGEKADSWTD